jgi:hypothetical protein
MQPSSKLRLRRTSLCRVPAALTFASRERSFRMEPHLPPAWPTAAAGPLSITSLTTSEPSARQFLEWF